jgi:hypothetical protein
MERECKGHFRNHIKIKGCLASFEDELRNKVRQVNRIIYIK